MRFRSLLYGAEWEWISVCVWVCGGISLCCIPLHHTHSHSGLIDMKVAQLWCCWFGLSRLLTALGRTHHLTYIIRRNTSSDESKNQRQSLLALRCFPWVKCLAHSVWTSRPQFHWAPRASTNFLLHLDSWEIPTPLPRIVRMSLYALFHWPISIQRLPPPRLWLALIWNLWSFACSFSSTCCDQTQVLFASSLTVKLPPNVSSLNLSLRLCAVLYLPTALLIHVCVCVCVCPNLYLRWQNAVLATTTLPEPSVCLCLLLLLLNP